MKNLVLLLTLCFVITSCKDEKPEIIVPDPEAPTLDFTFIKTADATLQATYIGTINKEHLVGTYTTFEGIAHAKFLNSAGAKVSPGSIICEGYTLQETDGLLQTKSENEQGIDFGSTTSWQVSGKGDIPGFTKEVLHKVPEIGDINIQDSINIKDSVWIKINHASAFTNLGNIDSVNYRLVGKLGELQYNLSTPKDSVGISSAQLNSLGSGKIYIQVEVYRLEIENQQGYKVAYVNKGMFYKSVWLF